MPDSTMEPQTVGGTNSGWSAPAIASGVASLGGSITSGIGNRRAIKWANRNFNTSMAFNEHMASTQWQRTIADMKAAGINPMLAYGSGPNASGSVGMPSIDAGAGVGEGIKDIVNSAMQVMVLGAQRDKTRAEAELLEADAAWAASNASTRHDMLVAQFEKLGYEVEKADLDKQLSRLDLEKMRPLVLRFQELTNEAARLSMPEKEATAKFWNTIPEAKWMDVVKQVLMAIKR